MSRRWTFVRSCAVVALCALPLSGGACRTRRLDPFAPGGPRPFHKNVTRATLFQVEREDPNHFIRTIGFVWFQQKNAAGEWMGEVLVGGPPPGVAFIGVPGAPKPGDDVWTDVGNGPLLGQLCSHATELDHPTPWRCSFHEDDPNYNRTPLGPCNQ